MNILYVGHYRESSGWGQAARDYILALDHVGVNVVPRSINLGQANFDLPSRIKELELQSTSNCNVIIQHVLPHYMKYDSHFSRNIGLFVVESKNMEHIPWVDNLNIMDELWVPCTDMLDIRGVKTPSFLVPHTFDRKDYSQDYSPLDIPNLKNKFVFYFIGEYNRRKHIGALLRAFHTEFHPSEPVSLVLKVNKPGLNEKDLASEMVALTEKIKTLLGLYKDTERYNKEIIITINISREEILRLHRTCDCFVCPSFGEAWCIPAFESMAMGNMVIASKIGGPKDYIDSGVNGYLVEGSMEPLFGETENPWGFGTSRELEFDISISDLQKNMRRAYEGRDGKTLLMRQNAKLSIGQYSYEAVGNKMKELLNV